MGLRAKIILLLVLVLFSVASPLLPPAHGLGSGVELIENGGFESGQLQPWQTCCYMSGMNDPFMAESTVVRSGSYALQVVSPVPSTGGNIGQASPATTEPWVDPRDTFSFSFYFANRNNLISIYLYFVAPGNASAYLFYSITDTSLTSPAGFWFSNQPVGVWVDVSRNIYTDLKNSGYDPSALKYGGQAPGHLILMSSDDTNGGADNGVQYFDDFSIIAYGSTSGAASVAVTSSQTGSGFVATNLVPHQASMPTMEEGGTVSLAGQNDVRVSLVDPAHGYAYFGLHSSASGSIARVRLSDFTLVDTLSLNTDERGVYTGVIDPEGGFAYFGTSASVLTQASPSTIVKVNLATFTRVASLTLNDLPIGSSAIDLVNGYAYFGTNGNVSIPSDPQLVKVNLATFTIAGYLDLGYNATTFASYSVVVDALGHFAYVGNSGNGDILKVDLSSFTVASTLHLSNSVAEMYAAAIDDSSGYLYYGTLTNDLLPISVFKVRLSDFTLVATLNILPILPRIALASASIDSANGFLYFTGDVEPGEVLQIRLSDFTVGETLTLAEDYPWASAIDPVNQALYLGTVSPNPVGKAIRVCLNACQTAQSFVVPTVLGTIGLVVATVIGAIRRRSRSGAVRPAPHAVATAPQTLRSTSHG